MGLPAIRGADSCLCVTHYSGANVHCTRSNIESSIANGQPVIATVDFSFRDGKYADPNAELEKDKDRGSHALLVYGMELDEEGNVVAFIANDTARGGGCGVRIPQERFNDSNATSLKKAMKLTRPTRPCW
jgi:hypothetical protein